MRVQVAIGITLIGTCSLTWAGPINTYDRGWYDSTGAHSPSNDTYLVGENDSFRDFFAFALPNAPAGQEVISATLWTNAAGVSGAQTVTLREYSGSITSLTAGGSASAAGVARFNDLGSGTVFGSYNFLGTEGFQLVGYTLNANAIAAINASLGGDFAIGGRSDGSTGSYAYSNSGSSGFTSNPADGNTYLNITFSDNPVIPLPTGAAMVMVGMGAGMGVIGVRRRRPISKDS